MTISWLMLTVLAAYLGAGFLFALAFVARGVDRIDRNAKGASIGFRLVILPGVAALWPLMLRRWAVATRPASAPLDTGVGHAAQRRIHGLVWAVLGPLMLIALVLMLSRLPSVDQVATNTPSGQSTGAPTSAPDASPSPLETGDRSAAP